MGSGVHRCVRIAAAVIACLCLLGIETGAADAQSSTAISAVNGWSVEQLGLPAYDPQLAAMAGDGIQVVRSDAPWYLIEPHAPGAAGPVWQAWQTDNWVADLAYRHLTWEPIIDYSAPWTTQPGCQATCAPASYADYATFAQFVAARYGPGGSFWSLHPNLPYLPVRTFEIWNEEDGSYFWWPGPDAATYDQLYAMARTAIRAVDPSAQVIVGGLTDALPKPGASLDYAGWFVTWMLYADPALKGNIDGFGLHPYGADAGAVEQMVATFRHEIDGLGFQANPIDITEFGWTTGDATRESWRAQQMSAVARAVGKSNCGIGLLAPYDWSNPAFLNEPGDFGLVDRTGIDTTLRPAGAAWFNGLAAAEVAPPSRLCAPNSHNNSSLSHARVPATRRRNAHHRRHRHRRRRIRH